MPVSPEVTALIAALVADKRIEVQPTPVMTYAYDGEVLDLPVANPKSVGTGYKYKTPHWLPLEARVRP
jgi:hypothetical protein